MSPDHRCAEGGEGDRFPQVIFLRDCSPQKISVAMFISEVNIFLVALHDLKYYKRARNWSKNAFEEAKVQKISCPDPFPWTRFIGS